MPHLKTNSADIFYESWLSSDSSHPWVYLVNGHTRSHKDFQFMAKFLSEKGFNVIAHDNRGSGQSKIYQAVTLDSFTEDLLAVIKHTHQSTAPIYVLGISMGGVIAQNLAVYAPDLAAKLVLVSTCPRPRPWMIKSEGLWPHDLDKIVQRLETYFSPNFRSKNAMLIKAMAKNIQQLAVGDNFSEKAEEQRLAMKGFDLSEKIAQIKIPTYVIHGEVDEIIDVQAAHFLADHIPKSTLKIYPEAGHLLIAELGKVLYQDVFDFIRL